jgi:hypothetical protein
MSKQMKFKLNQAGVRELMRSAEMMNVCRSYAGRALQRLGDGYEADSYVGQNRCNAMVYAKSYKARRENSKNNTVLKAVRG